MCLGLQRETAGSLSSNRFVPPITLSGVSVREDPKYTA